MSDRPAGSAPTGAHPSKKRSDTTGLTEAEAAFVSTFLSLPLEERSGTEAYARLHPAASRETCKSEGKRYLESPAVKAVLDRAQIDMIERGICTMAGHLEDLKTLRNLAAKAGKFDAAVKAEELRGRAAGIYVDRQRHEFVLTPELVKAIDLGLLNDDELEQVRAGRITDELVARMQSSARAAATEGGS